VSSFATIEALPIHTVLLWPLSVLLPLPILTTQVSNLQSVGALDELALQGLVALHCSLGSLLELWSGLLLRGTLDRSNIWHTYPRPGIITTLTLALLLPLAFHDTVTVFQHQCLVHHVLKILKVSGLQCISQFIIEPTEETILFFLVSVHIVRGVVR
jgi:hypothetical protein